MKLVEWRFFLGLVLGFVGIKVLGFVVKKLKIYRKLEEYLQRKGDIN